jgi:hypothetical protein
MSACAYSSFSGHHPFDYGDTEAGEDQPELSNLMSWEENLSLDYVRNDRRVRRRIVDDDVEFCPAIWKCLQDGTLRRKSLLWM